MPFPVIDILADKFSQLRSDRAVALCGAESFFREKLLQEIQRKSGYRVEEAEGGSFLQALEELPNRRGLFEDTTIFTLDLDKCEKINESPGSVAQFFSGVWKQQQNILILHSASDDFSQFAALEAAVPMHVTSKLVEYRGEFYHWIKEWLAFRGLELSEELLKAFVNIAPRDLSLLDKEMEKLIRYPGRLGFKEVRELSGGLREQTFDAFLSLLNTSSAIPAMEKLKYLRLAFTDSQILSNISQHLVKLMAVAQKAQAGKSNDAIAQDIGMSSYRVRILRAAGARYPIPKLVRFLEEAANLDERSCASGSVGIGLDLFVLQLCSIKVD